MTREHRPNSGEDIDWGAVSKRLTVYAHRRLQRFGMEDPALAEDLALEAVRRFFDEEYASFDGPRDQLLHHLGSVVNGQVMNLLRKASTTREILANTSSTEHKTPMRDPSPSVEHRLIVRAGLEVLVEEVRRRLGDDAVGHQVFDAWLGGEHSPGTIAESLGLDPNEIYKANRRLRQHVTRARVTLDVDLDTHDRARSA